jgi:hypothetical protein
MSAGDIVLQDSFDRYNSVTTPPGLQANWITLDGGANFVAQLVAGRLGGQALRNTHSLTNLFSEGYEQRGFSSPQSEFIAHYAFRSSTFPDADTVKPIYSWMSGSTHQVGMRLSTLGELVFYRQSSDTAGTELGRTPTNTIIQNTWHFLKIRIKISDTVGEIEVYVDNNQKLSLTAQDTKNHASVGTCDIMRIGNGTNQMVVVSYDTDDLYVVSGGTFLPEATFVILNPTSDVAQGFSRSTGATNYTLVDEDPVSTTDYVESAMIGTVDTYGFEDLASTPKNVLAVVMTAVARKTDAGDRSLALQVKSGATTSDGSSNGLSTTSLHYERIMQVDPNTLAAWTAAAVNAIQGGPKVAA